MIVKPGSIVRNTAFNGASLFWTAGINILLVPILISLLGFEQFGLIGILTIFSMVGYISLLDFGIPASIQRYVASYLRNGETQKAKELITIGLIIFFFIGLLLFFVIFHSAHFLTYELLNIPENYRAAFSRILRQYSTLYVLTFPALIMKSYLQAKMQFLNLLIITVASDIFKLLLVVFPLSEPNFEYIGKVYIGGIFINATLFLCFIPVVLTKFNIRKIRYFTIEIKNYLKHQIVAKFSSVVLNQSDRILLGVFAGPSLMGMYDVAVKIPSLISRISGVASTTLIPATSGLSLKDHRKLIVRIYNKGLFYYCVLMFPIIIYIFVDLEFILKLWVGDVKDEVLVLSRILLIWNLSAVFTFGGNLLYGIGEGLKGLSNFRLSQALLKFISLSLLLYFSDSILTIGMSYLIAQISAVILLKLFKQYFELKIAILFWMLKLVFVSSLFVWLLSYVTMHIPSTNIPLDILVGTLKVVSLYIVIYLTLGKAHKIMVKDLYRYGISR